MNWTLAAGFENLTLTGTATSGTGNDSDNVLTGNARDNTLDGRGGDDVMIGGAGDDTYVVGSLSDKVDETGGSGTDVVISSVDWTLDAGVENLLLMEGTRIDGTGNGSDNPITGNSSANILNGRGGDDKMAGGRGDDTYIVDAIGDRVDESDSDGIDLVKSAVNWTLGAGLENLTLTGAAISATGNSDDNELTGNAENNILDGRGGNDVMIGGAGDDTYVVGSQGDKLIDTGGSDLVKSALNWTLAAGFEHLTLLGSAINGTGNGADNELTGNNKANVLNGGDGNDILDDGGGNDSYYLDTIGDTISDSGGKADKVYASFGITLQFDKELSKTAHLLKGGLSIEQLELTGSGDFGAAGNAADNIITGNIGKNFLRGFGGSDILIGGDGNDTVRGGSSGDRLIGGDGIDTVDYMDAPNGLTINLAAPSKSTLYAKGDTFDSIENVTGSTWADIIIGTAEQNTIRGDEGRDVIEGGGGADELYGGADGDTLVFRTASASSDTDWDTIHDFTSADSIDLRSIDANAKLGGNQAFSFIGSGAFSNHAGDLRSVKAGSETYIHGDVDGDGNIDLKIHLDHAVTMSKGFFML